MEEKKDYKNEEIKKGIKALKFVIRNKVDFYNAFINLEIGNVTLLYGKAGNINNNFKGGFGISHIISKRNSEERNSGYKTAVKLIETIVNGKIIKTIPSKKTVHILFENYEAILSLDLHGETVTWLITGYKIKKGL